LGIHKSPIAFRLCHTYKKPITEQQLLRVQLQNYLHLVERSLSP